VRLRTANISSLPAESLAEAIAMAKYTLFERCDARTLHTLRL